MALLLAGCGVSREEFQGFQTKVQGELTAQGARIGEVEKVVQAIPGIATDIAAIRDDIKDLKKDQEKDQAVQAVQDQLNAEKAGRQLDALKAKDAELEKDVSEIKDEIKDLDRYPCPQSEVRFFAPRDGYYEFIITPNVEIFIDGGRSVVSRGIIHLTYGWHKYYWPNSPVTVTIYYRY